MTEHSPTHPPYDAPLEADVEGRPALERLGSERGIDASRARATKLRTGGDGSEPETGLIALDEDTKRRLVSEAEAMAERLMSVNVHAPDFTEEANRIVDLGRREIAEAASQPHRSFARSLNAVEREGTVGTQLVALRRAIETFDPNLSGRFTALRRVLRFVPFGSRFRDTIDGWRSAEQHIAAILQRLASGKDEILRDNLAIDDERRRLWTAMERLAQLIHSARALDDALERHLAELDGREADRARAIRETALFPTRQRQQDLLTQMAVSVQGYLALAVVRRSNAELAKGVDRASTTTVAALRTAISVSQALTSQKRVLDQVETFNARTAGIIDRTNTMLHCQTDTILKQASSATIPVGTLQRAFRAVYEALDAADSSKIRALDSMKVAIGTLTAELEGARPRLAQVKREDLPVGHAVKNASS